MPLTQATTQLHTQPFSKLLNAEVAELGEDKVVLRVPITEQVLQQHGFVHGQCVDLCGVFVAKAKRGDVGIQNQLRAASQGRSAVGAGVHGACR